VQVQFGLGQGVEPVVHGNNLGQLKHGRQVYLHALKHAALNGTNGK
jgi:hypothetical protein